MPNWCENSLDITCRNKEDATELLKKISGYSVVWDTDAYERAEIESDINSDVIEGLYAPPIVKQYHEDAFSYLSFDSIIPIPDDILIEGYNVAGYNWCADEWGTKWDVTINDDDELSETFTLSEDGIHMSFMFNTAWAPPLPVIFKLLEDDNFARHISTLEFNYYEMGMNFGGVVEYDKMAGITESTTASDSSLYMEYDDEEDED